MQVPAQNAGSPRRLQVEMTYTKDFDLQKQPSGGSAGKTRPCSLCGAVKQPRTGSRRNLPV